MLDLSRVLAGPSCTQVLGDLGADVIKVERPGRGDDTRGWGPPYLKDGDGNDTSEAAYYLSTNRNKRSVTIDLALPQGQDLIRQLASQCDVLVENFKVGGLAKYGLDHQAICDAQPELVYCSISGFGQTGPRAAAPGYDFMIQGMGGIMSLTGDPDGPPTKVGVAIADIMCGMYASVAILGALFHRNQSGVGQHIDLGLMDTQVGWLANEALNYFTSGKVPHRMGNTHPNLVPYQVFSTSDDDIVVAVGNDGQFARYCNFAGRPDLAEDERFSTMRGRIVNRDILVPMLEDAMRTKSADEWIAGLEIAGVPCGPVRDLAQVFDDPQIAARGMKIEMPHEAAGVVPLVGNPINYSATPVSYRHPPPMLGQHTDEILQELLDLPGAELDQLREDGVI